MPYQTDQDVGFAAIWRWLSFSGVCDEIGGAEYYRVKREWLDANRPNNIVGYIKRHANRIRKPEEKDAAS